ncbi:aspartate aminotransferase family protein [Cryomorphaceae bacterium]|nr:aspartate aminotransferase family protein [Cryomorphaceae bacterium]
MSQREDFLQFQAQTTDYASGFEVDRAEGCYIYGRDGKRYLDLVAGVSACNMGHGHPSINKAIKDQVDQYLHVMVYGEYAQDKPIELSKRLASLLPEPLQSVYLVNSGTEAIEGALKLAKRYTRRSEIVAAKGAYHGATHGALSVTGNDEWTRSMRPLLPGVRFLEFNRAEDLELITDQTAAVILETIQGANGFVTPENDYLKRVRERCNETGALLILDEIQPGFGRTGKLFGFQQYGIVPDILVVGKAMGGGLPIGAFISSPKIMDVLRRNPMLGHITTFGGHPVPAAAALAHLDALHHEGVMDQIERKEALLRSELAHRAVKAQTGKGLMLALHLESAELVQAVAKRAMDKGVILFWLLFTGNALRITPPLTISEDQIKEGCRVIRECLDELS